jgi:hypothetical protein
MLTQVTTTRVRIPKTAHLSQTRLACSGTEYSPGKTRRMGPGTVTYRLKRQAKQKGYEGHCRSDSSKENRQKLQDDFGASEFSGGRLTGPMLSMFDNGSLMFILALHSYVNFLGLVNSSPTEPSSSMPRDRRL